MRRILIVDDDSSSRVLMQRILETVPGLETTLSEGADNALELLGQQTYDLVLLDLLMPGMGGIELLTRMRKSAANKTTAVIIVSAMTDSATKIACQSLGVADYVEKPIRREAVIRSVKAALA